MDVKDQIITEQGRIIVDQEHTDALFDSMNNWTGNSLDQFLAEISAIAAMGTNSITRDALIDGLHMFGQAMYGSATAHNEALENYLSKL